MSGAKAFEVWDADNHMYETIDAYTRYLPEKYSEALKFVDINGRKKLQILGTVTECIPNPTYEVIPTPGAWAQTCRRGESRCGVDFRGTPGPADRLAIVPAACLSIPEPYGLIAVVAESQFRLFLLNPADICAST